MAPEIKLTASPPEIEFSAFSQDRQLRSLTFFKNRTCFC